MHKRIVIVALALGLITAAFTRTRAQASYEVAGSSAPANSGQAIEPERASHWVWWALGAALIGGIIVAIASSNKQSGGSSGRSGGY